MLIKCNCNHCSTHLEFEAGNEGEVVQCPSCGLDTTLYAPPPPPKPIQPPKPPPLPKPVAAPKKESAPSTIAETLNEVRVLSCYKTLRGLIDLVFAIYVAVAVLVCLGCIVQAVQTVESGDWEVAKPVLILLGAIAGVVVAVALKQAALLLVDIADCQIQLVKRSR